VRSLFGSGHGRFRTQGRFAAATVRGTIWQTEDYCDRTVITVKRGLVAVRDLHTGRSVDVGAGHSRAIRRR
jgi:ferric-dicitrate binding protein FerR (iron transport regulator)